MFHGDDGYILLESCTIPSFDLFYPAHTRASSFSSTLHILSTTWVQTNLILAIFHNQSLSCPIHYQVTHSRTLQALWMSLASHPCRTSSFIEIFDQDDINKMPIVVPYPTPIPIVGATNNLVLTTVLSKSSQKVLI